MWRLHAASGVTPRDLQGPALPPPSAPATFHSQPFPVQKDQGGDPSPSHRISPFPSLPLAALCPGAEQLPFQ